MQVLASLRHPACVAIYDCGQDAQAGLYYVMELLEGENVADVLASGQLNVQRAAEIAASVADALAYIHAKGVVHRDIKPANIFLDRSTAQEAVRLVDFGIARALFEPTITKAGQVPGTPGYMSPEQFSAPTDVDGRSDIFSFGATLFAMLTGRPPVEGPAEVAFARLLSGQVDRSPRKARPEVPEWLDEIVQRAMAFKREERFGSAADLVNALTDGIDRQYTIPSAIVRLGTRIEPTALDPHAFQRLGRDLYALGRSEKASVLQNPAVQFPLPISDVAPALLFPINMAHLGAAELPARMASAITAGIIAKYGKQAVAGQQLFDIVGDLSFELAETIEAQVRTNTFRMTGAAERVATAMSNLLEQAIPKLIELRLLDKPIKFKYVVALHSHGESAMGGKMLKVISWGGIYDSEAREIVSFISSINSMVNDYQALLGQIPHVYNHIIGKLVTGGEVVGPSLSQTDQHAPT
jgi:hypothetical protein